MLMNVVFKNNQHNAVIRVTAYHGLNFNVAIIQKCGYLAHPQN